MNKSFDLPLCGTAALAVTGQSIASSGSCFAEEVGRTIAGLPPTSQIGGGSRELALFEDMPIGLAVYDAQGVLAHSNKLFDQIVSCRQLPSSAVGGGHGWRGWAEDGSSLPAARFPCARATRGEIVSRGVDLLHTGSDGQARWLTVSAAPIVDPAADRIIGLVLLFMDAPARDRAAASSEQSARRLMQFSENSGSAIWIADPRTEQFSYRNPAHLRLTCGAAAVPTLAAWLDRVDDVDRTLVRRSYDLAIGGSTQRFEYRLRKDDGGIVRMRETCFPIGDEISEVTAIGGLTEAVIPSLPQAIYVVGKVPCYSAEFIKALKSQGNSIKAFQTLEEMLAIADFLAGGCMIVDLARTDDGEANLLRALGQCGSALSIIVIGRPETGTGAAVAAMRAGAADYLIPPLDEQALLQSITRAAAGISARARAPMGHDAARLAQLTPRERQVLAGLRRGGTNKSIGRALGISPRTVEIHRSHVMERLNVNSLAQLILESE